MESNTVLQLRPTWIWDASYSRKADDKLAEVKIHLSHPPVLYEDSTKHRYPKPHTRANQTQRVKSTQTFAPTSLVARDSNPEESTKSQQSKTPALCITPSPQLQPPEEEARTGTHLGKRRHSEAHRKSAAQVKPHRPHPPGQAHRFQPPRPSSTTQALTWQVLRLETPPGLAYQHGLVLSLLRGNKKQEERESKGKGGEKPGPETASGPYLLGGPGHPHAWLLGAPGRWAGGQAAGRALTSAMVQRSRRPRPQQPGVGPGAARDAAPPHAASAAVPAQPMAVGRCRAPPPGVLPAREVRRWLPAASGAGLEAGSRVRPCRCWLCTCWVSPSRISPWAFLWPLLGRVGRALMTVKACQRRLGWELAAAWGLEPLSAPWEPFGATKPGRGCEGCGGLLPAVSPPREAVVGVAEPGRGRSCVPRKLSESWGRFALPPWGFVWGLKGAYLATK